MSRPISIEELVKVERPKFIKKSKRQPKEETKVSIKRKPENKPEIVTNDEVVQPVKRYKIQPKKITRNQFNFDWNEGDDTSNAEYAPLIELNEFEESLDGAESGHWSKKPLEKMTERDWRGFKDEFNIIAKGTKIPPIRSWDELSINKRIVTILSELNYNEPTPIQRASIPIAIQEKDIIGIAETGSGKTLAYIIPLLNYILSIETLDEESNKPLGLILAPTRELANQITEQLNRFCSKLHLNTISIIGGHEHEETLKLIQKGVHIVVATPGRLIDSLERRIIDLSRCYYVIYDEADRMIDMGFEKSLVTLYQHLPEVDEFALHKFKVSKRVTLMFTATFSDSINSLTKQYLQDPVQLVIGKIGEKVDNIQQDFEFLQAKDLDKKFNKLLRVISRYSQRNNKQSIIIFANFIKTVEEISEQLSAKGYDNVTIHGSKNQQARERAVEDFRSGKKRILVATDVAARGIDIANVSLVINYQMTKQIDQYIHRIGRTGRAGAKGKSFTFIDEGDEEVFIDLRKFLKKNIPGWLAGYQTIRD